MSWCVRRSARTGDGDRGSAVQTRRPVGGRALAGAVPVGWDAVAWPASRARAPGESRPTPQASWAPVDLDDVGRCFECRLELAGLQGEPLDVGDGEFQVFSKLAVVAAQLG